MCYYWSYEFVFERKMLKEMPAVIEVINNFHLTL